MKKMSGRAAQGGGRCVEGMEGWGKKVKVVGRLDGDLMGEGKDGVTEKTGFKRVQLRREVGGGGGGTGRMDLTRVNRT